ILLKDNTCFIKVICTLESIDSIKSLKRSPQHIFVEVRVPGSGLRTLVHACTIIILYNIIS
ncbi:hypothetical protein Avbf_00142, partial [Armadillidium vulgare]